MRTLCLFISLTFLVSTLAFAAGPRSNGTTIDGPLVNAGGPLDGTLRLGERELDLTRSIDAADFFSSFRKTAGDAPKAALDELERLGVLIAKMNSESAIAHVREIWDSIRLRTVSPGPRHVDLFTLPYYAWKYSHVPIGKGKTEATNLANRADGIDRSQIDPVESTFWRKPPSIETQDLYLGFGRERLPEVGTEPCTYVGPKKSYGLHAGFTMKCGDTAWKAKFEVPGSAPTSEVFTTRIFGALGYHVEVNDFTPALRVKYDRRVLLEFNSRKPIHIKFTVLGALPLHTFSAQPVHDPFTYIVKAVRKDGAEMSAGALKAGLLKRPDSRRKNVRAEDFRTDAAILESEIAYVVWTDANLQTTDETFTSIGPWEWNALGHEDRRELRGLGLLAAWINWFDARFDNNRLKISNDPAHPELRHFFSDLGSGLGSGRNVVTLRSNDASAMEWIITRPRDEGKVTYHRFHAINGNRTFKAMTLDDARWMARMIAQFTENQLKQALIASGYNSAETKLFLEKLISRRDQMIIDLGLADEILPLRPVPMDRKFDYDPGTDGVMSAAYSGGRTAFAESIRVNRVRRGKLDRP